MAVRNPGGEERAKGRTTVYVRELDLYHTYKDMEQPCFSCGFLSRHARRTKRKRDSFKSICDLYVSPFIDQGVISCLIFYIFFILL